MKYVISVTLQRDLTYSLEATGTSWPPPAMTMEKFASMTCVPKTLVRSNLSRFYIFRCERANK